MHKRTTLNVYIDGFALYKGLLQKRFPEHKWLDLEALCKLLFPQSEVLAVKYFTAQLKPTTNDPGIGQRQQLYWRALRTTMVEIVEGTFIFSRQYLPKHPEILDEDGKAMTVRVKRPEEKGTDVALATHLILDALENKAESFAIVTNDSDLAPTVKALIERNFKVALVSVAGDKYNKAFEKVGVQTIKQIREGVLVLSQFPEQIHQPAGPVIKKPNAWIK